MVLSIFERTKHFRVTFDLTKVSFIYKILFKCKELDTVKFHTNAILNHCILQKESVRTLQRIQSASAVRTRRPMVF